MEFFEKITENPYKDLYWNVPEGQKRGRAAVIGGNAQSFRTPVKVSEYLANKFPLDEVQTVLPMSLKSKLPAMPNLVFLKDVEGGSFADDTELARVIDGADYGAIVGDLSKNAETMKAVSSAVLNSEKPLILTRDAVDLVAEGKLEQILMREELVVMGSLVQWQKVLRAVYYPKMLMPSQSLVQVTEAFHKFTLSYPVKIVSFHEGQILVSSNSKVKAVPLEKTGYSALTLWNGELAARILALNLYNPGKFIEATVAALLQ